MERECTWGRDGGFGERFTDGFSSRMESRAIIRALQRRMRLLWLRLDQALRRRWGWKGGIDGDGGM